MNIMNINSLPDNCFCIIFSHLPPSDLLRIKHVCLKWKKLQEKVCQRVSTLSILIGRQAEQLIQKATFTIENSPFVNFDQPEYLQQYQRLNQNHLKFHWFGYEKAEEIVRHFPNISQVQISIGGFERTHLGSNRSWKVVNMDPIIFLLKCWSAKLSTVHFYANLNAFDEEITDQSFNYLLSVLHSMSALLHLAIELTSTLHFPFTFEMPIVGQLETFYFAAPNSYSSIFPSLLKYGKANAKLVRIGFADSEQTYIEPNFYGMVTNRELCSKFTNLQISQQFYKADRQMTVFCRQFCNLRQLALTICNLPMFYRMMTLLRPLVSLKSLHLELATFWEIENSDDDDDDEVALKITLPRLQTVKKLHINSSAESHTVLSAIQWNQLVPNLETLHFSENGARYIDWGIGVFEDTRKEWLQTTLRPFRECTKLNIVCAAFCGEVEFWDSSDLWSE